MTRPNSAATAAVLVSMLLSACTPRSTGGGQIITGATPATYRYVVVSSTSAGIGEVAHAFVEKGYTVLRPEAFESLTNSNVPEGAVLVTSCTYLGVAMKSVNAGAVVSCEAIDYVTRKLVYSGNGKYTAIFDNDDLQVAVRNAFRDFPSTGRAGSITMAFDLGSRGRSDQVRGGVERGPSRVVRSGTGFFVDTIGDVVTNAHVVDSCGRIVANGASLQVVRLDVHNDLALLRYPRRGEPLLLRGGRSVRPGDPVVVVGFPLSTLLTSQATVTTGTVSALAGIGDDTRFIQISAPVQPGSSGGPVLDQRSSIVGVVVAKLNAITVARLTGDIPENVNFALSEGTLRNFLDVNDVPYQTMSSLKELSAADVADRTRQSVVQLQCFR